MNNSIPVYCFVAGRSGGHIVPALTYAQAYKKEAPTCRILFFSTTYKLDQTIIKDHPFIDFYIPLSFGGLSKNPLKMIRWFYQFFAALLIAWRALSRHKPEKIISIGGYVSLPICLIAWVKNIPIELYELNAVPGRATKCLAPFCTTIAVCFEKAKEYLPRNKCVSRPYPIRFAQHSAEGKTALLKKINFDESKKTILIIGGSQGSQFINNIIHDWVQFNEYTHALIQIVHQTGANPSIAWQDFYKRHEIPAITFDYSNTIEHYYNMADIIVCRSGAGSLFEALHFKKQIITIPLQTKTTAHQYDNAQEAYKMHPSLITVLDELNIKKNNTIFFSALNSFIHTAPLKEEKITTKEKY